MIAFAHENEEFMIDQVTPINMNRIVVTKHITSLQIPLSEVESVRDMHSADSNDIDKVIFTSASDE